jgi:lipopolysaccharide transport system ATP-binding protein
MWALRDLSFEIEPGEVIGVIGRNGAGKSTLLKILSRITEPTEGYAEIHGRVGSLLEVATGFHPELSGRENIFLNGAILGMRRSEILKNFDEIVAFAEVERFIDTPVKHYSSGMYLRLAFAVAAHLEPEILLVDEVLAVGDAAFQRKCLGKMQDVGQSGRTVFFVSHNMTAITRLCPRTLLLGGGRLICDGPSPQVVGAYLGSGLDTRAVHEWTDPLSAPQSDAVRLRAVRVCSGDGESADAIDMRRTIGLQMEYEVIEPGHVLVPNLYVHNEEGIRVFFSADVDSSWKTRARPVGRYVSTAWIPGHLLAEGTYLVTAAVSSPPMIVHFCERDTVAFQLFHPLEADSVRQHFPGTKAGIIEPRLNWETEVLDSQQEDPLLQHEPTLA